MKISATEFFKTWVDYIEHVSVDSKGTWRNAWDSNSEWSKLILGGKKSSNQTSPLGQFFQKKYGESLGFRSEDGLVDLSLFDEDSLIEIQQLDKNWGFETFEKENYPTSYLALIEHENDIYTAWQEIAKLSYFRAPLKVIITYYSDSANSEEKRSKEFEMITTTLREVLKATWDSFKEVSTTEYLLIVGGLVNEQLKWRNVIFEANGKERR